MGKGRSMSAREPTLEAIATSDHDCPGIHAPVEVAIPALNAAADTPYSFSRQCTWHGDPRTAGTRRVSVGLIQTTEPACPHCGSPLVEVVSAASWWAGARSMPIFPEYEALMRWSQGKCFADFDTLHNAYRQAMAGKA